MKSGPEAEFLSGLFGMLLLAAITFVALLALFLAPVFAVAGIPAVAYLLWRKSPKVKERDARARTEELYRTALALKAPPLEAHLALLNNALDQPPLTTAIDIYNMEGIQPPPPIPPICDSIEGARYRDKLHEYIGNVHDAERTEDFVHALIECMPRYKRTDGIFTATANLSNFEVQALIEPFYAYPDFFRALKRRLDRNLLEQKSILPVDYKGDNCAFAYLKDTPLLDLATRTLRVGLKARTEHTQIVAGSGSGKTSLIEYMIHCDLDVMNDCCVIVIDSQRQLMDRLAQRGLWTSEVAYFSPHLNLGINLFDVKSRDEEGSETETIAVIDLLEYVLSSLMDAKLTSKQETVFNYAVQLLMAVPGANLDAMRRLLRKGGLAEFVHHVPGLPQAAQDFFEHEFSQKQYESTKEEIMWRIDAMQRNPAFARIFSATRNPIDMAEEMAERKLILVDTDVNLLGDKGSSFFGRFFIALILKAARQRFTGEHRQVFLYIDECAALLDSRLQLMLQQARKANIGVILAHQDLEQARSAGILAAILGNTATKFAGRLSDSDARVMAANMRTSHEFLQSLPQYSFAMSAIGEKTLAVTADTWRLKQADQRSQNSYDLLIETMEERYGHKKPLPPPEPEAADDPPPSEPDGPPPQPRKPSDFKPDVVDAESEQLDDDDEIRPSTKL